jgi:hypothetical protein
LKTQSFENQYYLAWHIFLSEATHGFIALDLVTDRYFQIGGRGAEVLSALIEHQGQTQKLSEDFAPEVLESLLCQLLKQQVITARSEAGKSFSLLFLPRQKDFDTSRVSSNKPWMMMQCLLSLRRAERLLKQQAIAQIVSDVRQRKQACFAVTDQQLPQVQQALAVYERCRPWYPKPRVCLFDSLAMVEFLARLTLYPDWVFGVMEAPFAAHCWVQGGGYVINDEAERIRAYTPILMV